MLKTLIRRLGRFLRADQREQQQAKRRALRLCRLENRYARGNGYTIPLKTMIDPELYVAIKMAANKGLYDDVSSMMRQLMRREITRLGIPLCSASSGQGESAKQDHGKDNP